MNRTVILAALAASTGIVASAASAQELEAFNNPYALTLRFDSWSKPGTHLTSLPTAFETSATDYGSGYEDIFPNRGAAIDLSSSNTLQLDVTVNSGVAGFLVDLDDGEGDEFTYTFGYGFVPGGGIGGGNEYILQQPFDAPSGIPQGAGTFDFSQITGYNIELDPGSPTQSYDVLWNDISGVNISAALTWNNTGGTGDGATWDVATNQNWNDGAGPANYTDGSIVTFNDTNNGHYNVTLNTTVSPASVTVDNSSGDYTITGTGSIAGAGSLTKSGTGTLTLSTVNTYAGGTNVSDGKLLIGAAGALPANSAVSITGGTLQLGPSTGAETLSSLAITGTGSLDVGNNHFILSYAAGTQAAADTAIRGYLVSGYAGGTWVGSGIDSLTAAVTTGFSLGYADGADGVVAGLSSGQIEVKYTRYGDANLDGVVSGTDFTILVGNLGKSVNAWDKGDFNYDGVVSGTDFTLLVGNLGKAANGADITLPAADIAAIDAFAAANNFSLAAVPEPATLSVLAIGTIGVLSRRRRRNA
jgi:autotransporter-associated beta strand protein